MTYGKNFSGQLYKAEVAAWEGNGRKTPQPRPPKDLPPLTPAELDELPQLPAGWMWVKYNELCDLIRNGVSQKPEGNDGAKIFRISAVRPMSFDMNDYRFIDNSKGSFDDYFLEKGDLVFTRYNGSRHYVGVCAEFKSKEQFLYPDKLIQTKVLSSNMKSAYLEKALNSGASRSFVESKIRTTAGQSGISGGDIRNIPVPVCSVEEQQMLIDILEKQISIIEETERQIEQSLNQAEALRQSILKKAFAGQLVPQDPHDEPAGVLLARIRAAKQIK